MPAASQIMPINAMTVLYVLSLKWNRQPAVRILVLEVRPRIANDRAFLCGHLAASHRAGTCPMRKRLSR
jgi:hypothetical protein